MKTKEPAITVCMPVYNAACYLRECIDSILAQTFTDFELLIVDDGSTDNSRDIVRSYRDKRIRLMENRHDYIGSLNKLLDEAKGKYIARMDADDVMMPDRLAAQFEYMEEHGEADILGGGFYIYTDEAEKGQYLPKAKKISFEDLLAYCPLSHPTVIMRTSTIRSKKLHYNRKYIYAEDYFLWCEMFRLGLNLFNLNKIFIKYRKCDTQTSILHQQAQSKLTEDIKVHLCQWKLEQERSEFKRTVNVPLSDNMLSIVIPFLDEREEVVNTVRSVRETAGYKVDIIIINDCSQDDYPYEEELRPYKVVYTKNRIRLGAGMSKERGVQLAKTPYILLLDAHMRFYDKNWANRIIEELKANDNRLLCCQTKVLEKHNGEIIVPEAIDTYGAIIQFRSKNYIPQVVWNRREDAKDSSDNSIGCILGAGYAASKRYWNYIKGLQGLIHYGSEEQYLSIKSWMLGDGCYLIPDIVIGHIYRKAFPYTVSIPKKTVIIWLSLKCYSPHP